MRPKRIEEIKNYIYSNKTVALNQICDVFHISKSTLRRDLDDILAEGTIKKIYGGVTAIAENGLKPFNERNIANQEAKERIAFAAASEVENGDVIFIDSGTTTFYIINYMKDKKNITILTNSIEVIIQAIPYDNINVIALAGTLNRKTLSLTGAVSAQVLQGYNLSKAFMASTGYSIVSGVTNSSPLESDIKRVAVQRSQKVYLLADSSKSDVVSLITYCQLEQIDTLITDVSPSKEICDFIHSSGNRIVIAKKLF